MKYLIFNYNMINDTSVIYKKLLSDGISNRERDVIRLLLLDYSSKLISEKLNISSHTVDTHRRNILKKLNVSSTGELVGMLKMNQHFL